MASKIDFGRILVLGHRNIGDVLHNMAVLKPLRTAFPNADIHMLTSPLGYELLQGNPYLSTLFVFKKEQQKLKNLRNRASLVRQLRSHTYDLVINLKSGSFFPHFLGAKKVWSIPKPFKTLESKKTTHAIDLYLSPLREHGLDIQKKDLDLKIQTTETERRHLNNILSEIGISEDDRFIVFAPFSNWHAKEWPTNRYLKLANALFLKYKMKIIFVGGPDDQHKIENVQTPEHVITDLMGTLSLKELAALYERASFTLGVDSGPFHMAVNMQVPALALFGATSHHRAQPYFETGGVVRCEEDLGCNPCIPGSNFMACKVWNRTTPCMEAIPYEHVFEKSCKILDTLC